jgi:O-antigen ligase
MRVILVGKPFHRIGFSTLWIESTQTGCGGKSNVAAVGLFALAVGATLTIFLGDPFVNWGYALGIFLLGGYSTARKILAPTTFRVTVTGVVLAVIALWGFAQLATGVTVYRYVTWNASLEVAALAATAWIAAGIFHDTGLRLRFLRWFAWFGFGVSLISVVSYFTSQGRVLWFFFSPYPDAWGPFLSRNDFAGFMELSFPVALWLSISQTPRRVPIWVPAWMLAAGLASGSRAGAILLLAEAVVILTLICGVRPAAKFAMLAGALAMVAGAGTLAGRFAERDPWRYRREMAASTVAMIAEHPWRGFGLGTYANVYPAYATFDLGGVVEHAHNQWLEWAAEGGIPLSLLWLVLALRVSAPAVRSVWAIGIVAAFLHALVDYPFARFGLTAWNFMLIGALSSAAVREGPPQFHSTIEGGKRR